MQKFLLVSSLRKYQNYGHLKKKRKDFFWNLAILSSFFRKLGKPKNLGCFLGILGPLESLNNYSVNILTTSKVLSVSCVGLYCLIGTCAHRSNVPGKPKYQFVIDVVIFKLCFDA